MRMRNMSTPSRKFKLWFKNIKARPNSTQEIENWLKFACKTMSLRGDQDQQKIVYTITNRYRKSTYKKLSTANAWKVFKMVNHKQENFKREKAKIHTLLSRLEQQTARPNIVIKKTRTRTINRIGSQHADT